MGYIKCKKCGWQPENESDLELHHIVPRGLMGKDLDGRVYLCGFTKGNRCHKKLHERIRLYLKEATASWLSE